MTATFGHIAHELKTGRPHCHNIQGHTSHKLARTSLLRITKRIEFVQKLPQIHTNTRKEKNTPY